MEVLYDCEKFTLKEILGEKTIKIPKFQRNIVWNFKKKKEFIETLRAGSPFGSILVHKKDGEYRLIDGLQRISTIREYKQDPYKYSTYTDISSEYVMALIKYDFEDRNIVFNIEDSAVKKLCEDIQKNIYDLMSSGKKNDEIKFTTLRKFNFIKNDYKPFDYMSQIIDDFNNKMNIDDLIVPTIVYKGSDENLPTIFYNLNTGGVNLSKYETFSAKWNPKLFKIKDASITDKIVKKYEDLKKDSDLDVDILPGEIENEGITLFEYCYSISEILKEKKYEVILGNSNNRKSTDPIGFEILSLICGLSVNKAENLDYKLMNANEQFLINLKDIIVETFDVMTESLKEWIEGYNNVNNTLDSTYMLYHMAISYIRKNYYIDFYNYEIRDIRDVKWNEKYKKYLHLHYFKDYIGDFWKKNRQVSDLTREIEIYESLCRYARNVSESEWDNVFATFVSDQINDVGCTISIKTKIFLNYLIDLFGKLYPIFKLCKQQMICNFSSYLFI